MDMNDAGRIVAVIDRRIEKKSAVGATIETTWGEVCGLSADGKYASAYLYGDTDVASQDFRVPSHLALNIGDKVKVAWNARGERWVYDVAVGSAFPKVTINPNTGAILTGDGTSLPATPVSLSGHGSTHGPGQADPISHSINALTASDLVTAYPVGVSTFIGGTAEGWPADFVLITTVKWSDARIVQWVTAHSGQKVWVRHGHTSAFGTNAWGSFIPVTPADLERVRLSATDEASLASTLHALQIGPSTGANLAFDPNEILARNNGATASLHLNPDGGTVVVSANASGFLEVGTYPNLNSSRLGSGLLELRGATPYIDFANDNAIDYDVRLRLITDDVIEVEGGELRSDNEAWITPTKSNGWVRYDATWPDAQYRIDAQGYVHLRGMVSSGTVGAQIFALPAGYRPDIKELFAVVSGGALGRVDVTDTGAVVPQAPSVNAWVSLSGITFKAAL